MYATCSVHLAFFTMVKMLSRVEYNYKNLVFYYIILSISYILLFICYETKHRTETVTTDMFCDMEYN
jgi:hypothetical protein